MDKNTDFTRLIKQEHENKWVALNQSQNKILAYDSTLQTLMKKMEEHKETPVYMKVLPKDIQFAL